MTSPTAAVYPIGRPTGRCAATGEPLQPGERIVAVLIEPGPGEPLVRHDYKEAAWHDGSRPQPPAEVFAIWRTRMPDPQAPRKATIGTEELLDLFNQVRGRTGPRAEVFAYLLALMLLRKRALRPDGAAQGGGLRVRIPGTDETIDVPRPDLDDSLIAQAIEELGAVMAGDS